MSVNLTFNGQKENIHNQKYKWELNNTTWVLGIITHVYKQSCIFCWNTRGWENVFWAFTSFVPIDDISSLKTKQSIINQNRTQITLTFQDGFYSKVSPDSISKQSLCTATFSLVSGLFWYLVRTDSYLNMTQSL